MTIPAPEYAVVADDGHRWNLIARIPEQPRASLLWLPALGVAAKHYAPFAEALAARGIAVFLHEWRGNGSSSLRADREDDWGYRELLLHDLPASEASVTRATAGVPRLIGGHSLGGQLACCRLGLAPDIAQALWLVASGSPYWRAFPSPNRLWLPLAYRFLPWLARKRGALPGRLIGFGGNEARGVIRDWARSGLSGIYRGEGIDADLEAAMRELRLPIRALIMANDWLGPESSLRFLLSKLPGSEADIQKLDAQHLGTGADHFSWMKQPEAVAARLALDVPG
ncbi:MAG TPA: alpha/beta fold hydrolase [Luteimonas sp.]|nr:alpha/beta fold hydrolase [Luteimonas sp.]